MGYRKDMNLSDVELITKWQRGVGNYKVGGYCSFEQQHRLQQGRMRELINSTPPSIHLSNTQY